MSRDGAAEAPDPSRGGSRGYPVWYRSRMIKMWENGRSISLHVRFVGGGTTLRTRQISSVKYTIFLILGLEWEALMNCLRTVDIHGFNSKYNYYQYILQ